MRYSKHLAWSLGFAGLVFAFQNCSDVGFDSGSNTDLPSQNESGTLYDEHLELLKAEGIGYMALDTEASADNFGGYLGLYFNLKENSPLHLETDTILDGPFSNVSSQEGISASDPDFADDSVSPGYGYGERVSNWPVDCQKDLFAAGTLGQALASMNLRADQHIGYSGPITWNHASTFTFYKNPPPISPDDNDLEVEYIEARKKWEDSALFTKKVSDLDWDKAAGEFQEFLAYLQYVKGTYYCNE